jgi:protein-S-isoprenylcysteine O-methyltransferase Ste14
MNHANQELFGYICCAAAALFVLAIAWAWRELEREEWKHIQANRRKELADHEAWLRTIGRGPQLLRKPRLTEQQIVNGLHAGERREREE